MAEDFEIIEHTADIGIVAYGSDLKQVFANAGRGMFSIIADLEQVHETVARRIEASAPDRESLLVEWLNTLLYIFDVDNLLLKRFEVTDLSDTKIKARGYGEKADPKRHNIKLGVKAATYHMLNIDTSGGRYSARVILDI